MPIMKMILHFQSAAQPLSHTLHPPFSSVRRAGQNANRALEAAAVYRRRGHAGSACRRYIDVVGHVYLAPTSHPAITVPLSTAACV